MESRHVPVLLGRVLALLGPALEGHPAVLVDATVGLGGHAEALLAAHPALTLVGLDRDPEALPLAAERLAPYADRLRLRRRVYSALPEVLAELGLAAVDGVLFDLGVSSLQLDEARRGFAYAQDAPLDMRMDGSAGPTAADVLNQYSVAELTRVLREYGEERFAGRIAAAVVRERAREPFGSTLRLADLVRASIPAAARRTGGHPAKRTFQALRIEVNGELAVLRVALPAALDALRRGGRIAVLSYHSLEDRLVKRAFAAGARGSTPPGLPVELPEAAPVLQLLTRGAETPSPDEVAANPRAAALASSDRPRPVCPGRCPAGRAGPRRAGRDGAGGRVGSVCPRRAGRDGSAGRVGSVCPRPVCPGRCPAGRAGPGRAGRDGAAGRVGSVCPRSVCPGRGPAGGAGPGRAGRDRAAGRVGSVWRRPRYAGSARPHAVRPDRCPVGRAGSAEAGRRLAGRSARPFGSGRRAAGGRVWPARCAGRGGRPVGSCQECPFGGVGSVRPGSRDVSAGAGQAQAGRRFDRPRGRTASPCRPRLAHGAGRSEPSRAVGSGRPHPTAGIGAGRCGGA